MGVDVFFVISGYLMTKTLMRDVHPVLTAKRKFHALGKYVSDFYARRIKRLLPAASVTLLATLVAVYATGSYELIIKTARQIGASALFFQNWQLAYESTDYLKSSEPPTAVQHFWSLSLEEQFYLLWPVVLLVLLFATVNIFILYKKTKVGGVIAPVILLTVASFVYGYALTQTDPAEAYFSTPARVWELLLGAVIAFIPALKNYDLRLLLPWVGLGLIAYALYMLDGSNFPGWHALVPTIGTALVLYSGIITSTSPFSFNNVFSLGPIQKIGDWSYSLYLWHWPIIVLLPVFLRVDLDTHPLGMFIKVAIVLISIVIAWLSYRFIEIPSQKIVLKKGWVYVLFVATVTIIAAASYSLSLNTAQAAKEQTNELHKAVKSSSEKCLGAKSIVNASKCPTAFGKIDQKYKNIGASDDFSHLIDEGGKQCPRYDPKAAETSNPRVYCDVGDVTSDKQIVIFGDSHAMHWINAFDELGKRNGVRFRVFATYSCFISTESVSATVCRHRFDFIKGSGMLDKSSAVIVSTWIRYSAEFRLQPTTMTIKLIQSMTDTPIYLLEDIPFAGRLGGPSCFTKGFSCKNDVRNAVSEVKSVSARILREKVLDEKHIIRTDDMFCDGRFCYSFIGGVSTYFNTVVQNPEIQVAGNDHLSASYSFSTAEILEAKFKKLGLIDQ